MSHAPAGRTAGFNSNGAGNFRRTKPKAMRVTQVVRELYPRPVPQVREVRTLRPAPRRHLWPVAVGALLFKKGALVYAAQQYGVPRIYRRAMEANRRVNGHGTWAYRQASDLARLAVRAPKRALDAVERSTGAMRMLAELDRTYALSRNPLVLLIYAAAKQTPAYKAVKALQEMQDDGKAVK